jgi:hypothetical protein
MKPVQRNTRRRKKRTKGGNGSLAELKKIIGSKAATPTIINPDSKFVIVTYWWGRGRLNGNTGRPCPDVKKKMIAEGIEPVEEKAGVLFEEMIAAWEKSCADSNCNYMAIECPEFAQPGGYQLAINAKPLFIKKALELCYPRGVVYIDGDMTVNQYPAVFDMPNVDFAARSWNMDPRSSYTSKPLARMQPSEVARLVRRKGRQYREELADQFGNNSRVGKVEEVIAALSDLILDNEITGATVAALTVRQFANKYKFYRRIGLVALEAVKKQAVQGEICFDPYVFETSGGIMFFGASAAAHWLLDTWATAAALPIHAGKADDRVLSLIFQQKHAYLHVNFVALPIEYLWLTDRYAQYMFEPTNYKRDDIVFEHPACLTSEEMAVEQGAATSREPKFYEAYVSEEIDCERHGGVLDEASYFPRAEYGETFRPWMRYLSETAQQPVDVIWRDRDATPIEGATNTGNLVRVETIRDAVDALMRGDDVILGSAEPSEAAMKAYNSPLKYELIATNIADDRNTPPQLEAEYWPLFSPAAGAPIIMRAGNTVLIEMLSLCETISDLTEAFRASFVHLHRIRCAWI